MASPHNFIKNGRLYVRPVSQAPQIPFLAQPITRPREFSLWVRGKIEEPAFQLDNARMPPSMYQEVRNDLISFSPVEVSRSAFRRSNHAYTGVIDSKGTPYYFALDSRGISVREAPRDDGKVWKTFDLLADQERSMAANKRRTAASAEMVQMERELSKPQFVIVKSDFNWKRKTKERIPKKKLTKALVSVSREGRQHMVTTASGKMPVDRGEAITSLQNHMPAGFKVGAGVNVHQASVHAGAPSGDIDPNALHVMKPSEIADRGIHGNEINPEHLHSIQQAWGDGTKLDPIDVHVSPEGKWHVEDGNHRLHAAAHTDSPVAIRFRRTGSDWQPQSGSRDISNRIRSVQVTKSLSKAETHTGTMVALHIPPEIAAQIALPGGESAESMHVTLAYLGKELTEEQKSNALCAVRRFAQQSGPIRALLGGVGRFSASHTSEGNDVVYISVDSPDITRLRPKLLEELAAEGIEPSNAHGFVPHVTLMYVATTARTPIKRFPPVPVEFSGVSLTVADNKMMLPFTPGPLLVIKALHPDAAWAANELKAGRKVQHENGTRAYRNEKHNEVTHYTVVSPNGMKTTHDTAEEAGTAAHAHTKDHKAAPLPKATARIRKALPKKPKEEKTKKTPTKGASKKQVGAGGKTRYTYPSEKLGAGGKGKTKQQPLLVVRHDDSKNANPSELANQLGVSIQTLQRAAKRLGREGFSTFMRSRLKRFSAKHRIDPDYWGTLHEKLMGST